MPRRPRVVNSMEVVQSAMARSGAPLLEPVDGGSAARFATAVGATYPIRVFRVAALGGWALLVGLTIAVGFLLTRVILEIGGVSAWDERVNHWLAGTRTSRRPTWRGLCSR